MRRTAEPDEVRNKQARMDESDAEGTLKGARQLMKSETSDIRLEAVRMMGRIGTDSLPDLADAIYDADRAVSQEAFLYWTEGVASLPDVGKRSRLLSTALSVVEGQQKIDALATELAKLPRSLAVNSLVNVIQVAPPMAAEAAALQYQRLTTERYTTPQAAEAWLRTHGAPEVPVVPPRSGQDN